MECSQLAKIIKCNSGFDEGGKFILPGETGFIFNTYRTCICPFHFTAKPFFLTVCASHPNTKGKPRNSIQGEECFTSDGFSTLK